MKYQKCIVEQSALSKRGYSSTVELKKGSLA